MANGLIKPRMIADALKPAVKGNIINKAPFYFHELHELETFASFLKTAGAAPVLKTGDENLNENITATRQAYIDFKSKFQDVQIIENPQLYQSEESEPIMVCLNWMTIPDGCWFYELKEVSSLPKKDLQQAILSAFYLLTNEDYMHFSTAEDFHDFDYFLEEYLEQVLEEADEEEATETKALRKFYEKSPCKKMIKFYPRAFHRYANTDSDLGDWLRCIWHYRKYNWFRHVPVFLRNEDDYNPIDIGRSRGIMWAHNDRLSEMIAESINVDWQEGGSMDIADFAVYSRTAVWEEIQNLDIKKLSNDFTKIWAFDVSQLKYMYKYAHGEYDYVRRQVSASRRTNNLPNKRQRKQTKQAVRGNIAGRQRGKHRREPAVNRRGCARVRETA